MKNTPTNHGDCPVEKTLKIFGSKWTMALMHNMFDGKKRFGELQRSMPGISPKTLSERLQELEKAGILTKKVFAEVPLHVEYELTEKGDSFRNVIQSLKDWGDKT